MAGKRVARKDSQPVASSAGTRRRLGLMLREDRLRAGKTQEEAAEVIERHVTSMHKMENGLKNVRFRLEGDIQRLGDFYATPAKRIEEEKNLAKQTRTKGPYHQYKGLLSSTPEFDMFVNFEGEARRSVSFDNELVPGQLQTRAYALAINSLPGFDGRPRDMDEIINRVNFRMERQATTLTREDEPLEIDAILHENVLRLRVGEPAVMIEQLRHLAKMSELPNVSVRVVPSRVGLHLGCTTGQFIILHFPGDQPPAVYCDTYVGGSLYKDPEDIQGFQQAMHEIRRHALNEDESGALIEQVAKELAEHARSHQCRMEEVDA